MQCPVLGFWQAKHDDLVIEGKERQSIFACYKSHHPLDRLESFDVRPWKIIYVIRDPRDIVFSGMPFFYRRFRRQTRSGIFVRLLPTLLSYQLGGKRKMKMKMINAILFGDKHLHPWYARRPDVLKVTYKSLKKNPVDVSRSILQFLNTEKSNLEIEAAVRNQSFEVVRTKFKKKGKRRQVRFLRQGERGYWHTGLSQKQKMIFSHHVGDTLRQLGFDS